MFFAKRLFRLNNLIVAILFVNFVSHASVFTFDLASNNHESFKFSKRNESFVPNLNQSFVGIKSEENEFSEANKFFYVKNHTFLNLNGSLSREEPVNTSVLDALISVPLLMLLSLNNNISEVRTDFDNDTTSESRTLSNWLNLRRFRRPQRKDRPVRPTFSRPMVRIPPPPLVTSLFPRPEGFPGPEDPDAILLSPSLFEESGIKYWLKFIENGGNLDQVHFPEPIIGPGSGPGPVLRPIYIHNKRNRNKNPVRNNEQVNSKPIQIGEKPSGLKNNLYHEDTEEDVPKNTESTRNQEQTEMHKYDTSPRCDKFTSDICVDDFEYPEQAIVDEIYKRREIFELMYSEVNDNTPLVDGIPRDVEESYNYEHYYTPNDHEPQSSGSDYTNREKVNVPGGFVCPSEVLYGRPKLARNRNGDWKVIVNAAEFTQTVRLEKCLKPNSKCNYIASPEFNSRCAQVHSYSRLMVFEKGKGFYIDTFRMPTACSCHVSRRIIYKPLQSNVQETYDKPQTNQALSNTLWSILGGGHSTIESTQSQIKDHLNLLNQLKNLPQFSAQISPESVLQQLMDLQSPSSSGSKNYQHIIGTKSEKSPTNPLELFLPSLVTNDNSNSGAITKIHQSPSTTTFVHPNGNGAPVVQVIHVPVSSSVPANPAPVYRPTQSSQSSLAQYMDMESLLSKKRLTNHQINDEIIENFRPLLLQMQTKSNSTLMAPAPTKTNETKDLETASTMTIKSNSDDEKRKLQNAFNKKINFSYHPILDYIGN